MACPQTETRGQLFSASSINGSFTVWGAAPVHRGHFDECGSQLTQYEWLHAYVMNFVGNISTRHWEHVNREVSTSTCTPSDFKNTAVFGILFYELILQHTKTVTSSI